MRVARASVYTLLIRRQNQRSSKESKVNESTYTFPSHVTHAAIVDAGIADSSQRRFRISCLDMGSSSLYTRVRVML